MIRTKMIVGLAVLTMTLATMGGLCSADEEPFFEVQDLYEGKGNRIPNVVVAPDRSVLAFARGGGC